MKIGLTTSLAVSAVLIGAAFITATSYTQLGIVIVLYPIAAFIFYKFFLGKKQIKTPKAETFTTSKTESIKTDDKQMGIANIDKRIFLKLIGGTGIFLFLLSIFNKGSEGLFFKNLPGQDRLALTDTAGNKITPAQTQATDGYQITEMDYSTPAFYGFINKDGGWYIMKVDTATGSFRYTKGTTNFPDGWGNRKNLKYDYFSKIFS